MGDINYKKGQYAEIMTECAEHIYREFISKTERNYYFISQEGVRREVDVCTILTSGEKIAFEVRDRKSAQGIDWIDQIIGKYLNSPFKYIWICTFDGCKLTLGAMEKLRYHNIGWRDFTLLHEARLNQKPILLVRGIEIVTSNCDITVNNEAFQDIEWGINEKGETISFLEWKINESKDFIANNFNQFNNIHVINIEHKQDLRGIDNNFNCEEITINVEIPLKHITYVDYFNEEYHVIDNNNESDLISTKDKSIFVTDNTLAINFGYLSELRINTVLENSCIIDLKALPKKYRYINKMKFMDFSGEGEIIPMKVYAIKRDHLGN